MATASKTTSSITKTATRATAAILTGSIGYTYYYTDSEQGSLGRALKAYSTFAPTVLHYRYLEYKQNNPHLFPLSSSSKVSEKDWRELDEKYASPTVKRLGELQGMYSKYGQTAAGLTNTLGPKWIERLRTLEDRIPPRSVDTVYRTIVEETQGDKVKDTFQKFDKVPLGSASIGQVHRATLNDEEKREVAVKVQYPEAQELFTNDIHVIRNFVKLFAPEQVCTLDALEEQNAAELDYTNEADNLNRIYSNMKRHGFLPSEIEIPRPVGEYTTERMLVMELLPGVKLIDGINDYYTKWASENNTTLEQLEKDARLKIEREGIPDKYAGPSARQVALYRNYLKTKDAITNAMISAINYVRYHGKRIPYRHTTLPPNTPRIVDTLMRVHGHQLLVDGLFNADPHGGNFLLMPDGRIGCIDYGATKRLTLNERLTLCVAYVALKRGDKDILCLMSEIGGFKSKYGDKDVLYKLMQFSYDSFGIEVTEGKNIPQFMDDLKEKDPWYETPDNFVLASFMSVRLRSLALGMNYPVRCSDWWGEIAEEELRRYGVPYESWDREMFERFKPEVRIQRYDVG